MTMQKLERQLNDFLLKQTGDFAIVVKDLQTKETLSINEEKMEAQVRHMKETFERVAKENGGEAVVDVQRMYPGFSVSEDAPVIQTAARRCSGFQRSRPVQDPCYRHL